MQLTIRPVTVPQDYPAIAAVLEEENPGWGQSAEELAYADATCDPKGFVQIGATLRFVKRTIPE